MSELERFVEESSKMVGKEIGEIRVIEPYPLDVHRIRDFAWAMGDENPLFTDPTYASDSRYGSLIAPPTIVCKIRYPMSHGVLFQGDWKLYTYYSGNDIEWFDVFRPGDRITTSLILKDILQKQGRTGPLVVFKTEGWLKNQVGEVVARQNGTLITVKIPAGKTFGEHMIYERELYKYSKKEVDQIIKDVRSEVRRGNETRYWEDVQVGEKLTPVVKGPMHIGDMILWRLGAFPLTPMGTAGITPPGPFELSYLNTIKLPGLVRFNPETKWPYDHIEWEHEDFKLAHYRGLPGPFDLGVMRTELSGHLLTNWMGDDGFLRRLHTEIRKPNYYGDTTWFRGEVAKKYKVTEGKTEYGAVDITFAGVNQIGEVSTPGTATVYLPFRGREVTIPIPASAKA